MGVEWMGGEGCGREWMGVCGREWMGGGGLWKRGDGGGG